MTPNEYITYKTEDLDIGNLEWAKFCQSRLQRAIPEGDHLKLEHQGYDIVNAISRPLLDELISTVLDRQNDCRSTWKYPHQEKIKLDVDKDSELYSRVCEEVFATDQIIDQSLVNFFKSEYRIFSAGICRTVPIENYEGIYSFSWHRDTGPYYHTKLIIYLCDCDQIETGTEVINLKSTRALANVGYDFPNKKERKRDLSDFFDMAGLTPCSDFVSPKAGTALLFRPRDILHRGHAPEQNEARYALTFLLIPSEQRWQDALSHWPLKRAQDFAGKSITPPYCENLMVTDNLV